MIKTSFYNINPLDRIEPAKPAAKTSAGTASFFDALKTVAQKSSVIQVNTITSYLPIVQSTQRKDVKLEVPHYIQGHNECGPTSLAMVEKYYGIDPGNYHSMFSSDTVGHGPLALKEKALAKGLTVRQANNGSLEDLASLVDMGIPPMVLGIYGGGANSSLPNYIDNASRAHWMTVTGYKRDDTGKITHVYFNDPNRSATQLWTAADFQNKFWNNNIIPDGHRYFMAMTPRNNPAWSFQDAALKRYLPQDRLSSTFRSILATVNDLEKAFYYAESKGKSLVSSVENAWDTVSGWFS